MSVNISDSIGGPSAGLMFSLAIYDTLTPGSLTGDQVVAGTGTIDDEGKVGPIGGIQQKIVGARDDGAQLFLVPPDNCDEALGSRNGDMRLVKAVTMHAAVQAIEKWVKDPDAKLPTCAATTSGRPRDDHDVARTGEPGPIDEILDPALASAVLEIEKHIATARLGPARPPLRPRPDRRAGGEGARAGARDGPRRGGGRRLADAGGAGAARRRPRALAGVDHLAGRRRRLRGRGGAAGAAARAPRPRSSRTPTGATAYAREHPDRQDVRIVAGATRAGATYCALRLRAADDDQSVLTGAELVPGLLALLRDTLEDPTADVPDDPEERTFGERPV